MDTLLQIKGKIFGKGCPLVSVPVMDAKAEEILSEVRRLVETGAQMIEWRADAFENVDDFDAVADVLAKMQTLMSNTILLFTFRSKEQGGLRTIPQDRLYALHRMAAESGVVDILDMEFQNTELLQTEIADLQHIGVKVVVSYHDFQKTPEAEIIRDLLERMKQTGADIVKLAVMPLQPADVLLLLNETEQFHRAYPSHPLITMSMGKMGLVSRIFGEIFGSCVTFGAGKNASAPGQIPASDLEELLRLVTLENIDF